MKRKILSLALALMMIVSVAAALPVSAITSADLTEDVTYYNLDASTLTKTTDVESAGTVNVTNGNIYGTWNGTSYVDWTTKGVSEMNGNGKYARFSFEAVAGVYDMYIATGVLGTATSVNAEVTVNGIVPQTTYACATAGVQYKPAEAYIGQFVLNEGTNTVTIGATSNGVLYLYNVLLVRVDDTDIVYDAPVNHVKSSTGLVFTNSSQLAMEPTGVDWANKGTVQLFATGAATYNYIEVPQTGYYDVYAAVAQPNADASATLQVGGASNTASIAQTAGATTAAENNLGQFYLTANAANVVKFTANTSDTYLYNLKFVWADPQPAAQYTITANASAGGTATGTATVEEGESVTLTATPSIDYKFIGWYDENDELVCETAEFVVENVIADKTYTAKFEQVVAVNIPYDSTKILKQNGVAGSAYDRSTYVISSRTNCDWATDGAMSVTSKYWAGYWSTFTAPQTGYYDVWVAAGVTVDSPVVAWVDNCAVESTLTATGGSKVVQGFKIGRIYVSAGTNTLTLAGKNAQTESNKSGLCFYDVRLEMSENQTDAGEYVIDAQTFAPSEGMTYLPSGFTTAVAADRAGWATPGYRHSGSLGAYTVNIDSAGYYDVYAGASAGSTSKLSVSVYGATLVDSALLTNSNTTSFNEVDSTHIGKIYLKSGVNTITLGMGTFSGDYHLFNVKLSKCASQPAANDVRLVGNGGLDLDSTFYAGTKAYGEVKTTSNVKVFVVNYQDLGDGLMKMVGCAEGDVIVTDGSTKIVRTTTPVETQTGTVKVFLWDGTTYAPIDMVNATVEAVPTPAE